MNLYRLYIQNSLNVIAYSFEVYSVSKVNNPKHFKSGQLLALLFYKENCPLKEKNLIYILGHIFNYNCRYIYIFNIKF